MVVMLSMFVYTNLIKLRMKDHNEIQFQCGAFYISLKLSDQIEGKKTRSNFSFNIDLHTFLCVYKYTWFHWFCWKFKSKITLKTDEKEMRGDMWLTRSEVVLLTSVDFYRYPIWLIYILLDSMRSENLHYMFLQFQMSWNYQ